MLIFAHRGASGHAPENTLSAIELALSLPIYGVEIDVFEVDGEYIVFHDRWLTRITGEHKRLDQLSVDALLQLPAGIYQQQTQHIPRLSDVLALDFSQHRLNIELKTIGNLAHFHDYVKQHQNPQTLPFEHLIVSSFNHDYLSAAKTSFPDCSLGWLSASANLRRAEDAQQIGCDWVSYDIDVISQALVDDVHQRGMKVAVYTVNETLDMKWLSTMGVDAIFTNYPAEALQLLNASPA